MPIPSAISDLSTTPALNSPAGSESPALVDDYLRTHAAFIKQVNDASVKTTGDQTIAGTKTFTSPLDGTGIIDTDALQNNAVTYPKIQAMAANSLLGNYSVGVQPPSAVAAADVRTMIGANNASNITLGTLASDRLPIIPAANITGALNATGSAPIYACRAWVNFNGTGTVAIRASGNVSSITDNGTGDYTVNFTTAMPDANYAIAGAARDTSFNASTVSYSSSATPSVSSVRVTTGVWNGASIVLSDTVIVSVAIFR